MGLIRVALVLVILAWGAGMEGQDDGLTRNGFVDFGGRTLGSFTPTRPGALLGATPTASPAALATPGVLVQEPAEAEVEGRASGDRCNAGRPSNDVAVTSRREDTLTHNFLRGYFAGGGDPAWEDRVLSMVECESDWKLDPLGPHLGLAQFAPGTWEKAKCFPDADYRSAWEQGCAVANWMQQILGRWGTSEGWPSCW